ncbi:DUF1488 family protein [Pseudomonas benzopyrenica]|uniref:DUF1488 family protein n=1 Tax=Pseudomonas benzopyrenica TaxID=2993566 RepID=UPI003F17E299
MWYYFDIGNVVSDEEKEAVLFVAEREGKKVLCSISWQILQEHFNNDGPEESQDPRWSNPFWWYVNHQHIFHTKAQELIWAGRFESDGSIVLRLEDVYQEKESENDDVAIPRIPAAELPFVVPEAGSMSLADISAWYRYMIPKIEEYVNDIDEPAEKLMMAWRLKREIRRASAIAVLDEELTEEFYRKFPFKKIDAMLEVYREEPSRGNAELLAYQALISLTEKERCAYPGRTGGEVKHWVDGKAIFLSDGKCT